MHSCVSDCPQFIISISTGVQENEFVQTIPTITSVKNEAVDEGSKEEKQQEEKLEVAYTNKVQTQQNEFDAKKNIPEV